MKKSNLILGFVCLASLGLVIVRESLGLSYETLKMLGSTSLLSAMLWIISLCAHSGIDNQN